MFKSAQGKNKINKAPVLKPNSSFGFLCSLFLKAKNTLERAGAIFNKKKLYKPINNPPYTYWIEKDRKLLILIFIFLTITGQAFAYTDSQICEAIGKAENSVKFPYGIKSIDTHGNKEYARKICMNTIRNNRKRFANQTKYKDYIEFLGSRFCPPKAHKLNVHWVKNVRYFLEKNN